MKFGLVVQNYCGGARKGSTPSLEKIVGFARRAEEIGIEALWVIDHPFVAEPIYSTTWLDPFVTLAAIASRTESIKLGTSVIVLPFRNPVILAKQVSSLDVISNGRVIFGVGIGWFDKEFEACGVPKRQRGSRLEEYIEIIKCLWREGRSSFEGRYFSFRDAELEPKPLQKPWPPIWIAGGAATGRAAGVYKVEEDKVLKRIARMGDGWIARAYTDNRQIGDGWRRLKGYLSEYGRSEGDFVFAHINWVYIVEGEDEATLRGIFSKNLNIPFEDSKQQAILGERREVVAKLEELNSMGLQHLIVWPTDYDDRLMRFLADEAIPCFG